MKVTAIKDFNRKADNKPYWRVELEGSEIPLLLFSKPEFAEGTEIDAGNLKASKDGKYYTLATQSKSSESRPRYSKNDDAILQAVAFKGAIELEKHHYVPEGKVDADRVLRFTRALFDGLKKMLAGEEK